MAMINGFLPALDELLSETGALVTLEKIKVLRYRARQET